MDFLTRVTRHLRDAQAEDPTPMVKGRDVVILGGGDTGNDCAGSCVRLGAKSVMQLEMMPRPPVARTEQNSWPQWPKTLKTDYGQEEAAGIWGADPGIYETTIKEVLTENGHITKVRTAAVRPSGKAGFGVEMVRKQPPAWRPARSWCIIFPLGTECGRMRVLLCTA
jgi:glutamate synthase (NADPH/NADH) small chain